MQVEVNAPTEDAAVAAITKAYDVHGSVSTVGLDVLDTMELDN